MIFIIIKINHTVSELNNFDVKKIYILKLSNVFIMRIIVSRWQHTCDLNLRFVSLQS